jgi:hypothetical protein
MLSRELMGLLALGILWLNTLLVAAAAAKELAALLEKRRSLRALNLGAGDQGAGVVMGRVLRGDGPGGALAAQSIEQIGRSAGEGGEAGSTRAILFSDRAASGVIFGGALRVELAPGKTEEVTVAAAEGAEVWLPKEELEKAAEGPSAERFDRAYEDAKKARGFARTVTASVEPGRTVWVAGELTREGSAGVFCICPVRGGAALVSTVDPRALCSRKIALSVAAIAGILAGAAGSTALALTRPHFGLVSTIGGAASLAFFLLVQPAGTALRDAVRLPHRAFLRGAWRRDEGALSAEATRAQRLS